MLIILNDLESCDIYQFLIVFHKLLEIEILPIIYKRYIDKLNLNYYSSFMMYKLKFWHIQLMMSRSDENKFTFKIPILPLMNRQEFYNEFYSYVDNYGHMLSKSLDYKLLEKVNMMWCSVVYTYKMEMEDYKPEDDLLSDCIEFEEKQEILDYSSYDYSFQEYESYQHSVFKKVMTSLHARDYTKLSFDTFLNISKYLNKYICKCGCYKYFPIRFSEENEYMKMHEGICIDCLHEKRLKYKCIQGVPLITNYEKYFNREFKYINSIGVYYVYKYSIINSS